MSNYSSTDHYVGNPYNFVSLPVKKINASEMDTASSEKVRKLPGYSKIDSELNTGVITFTINTQTPSCIGDESGNFFYKNADGKYAIPGTSIKGLIRTNMKILGQGAIGEDIEDFRLMYRTVGAASKLSLNEDYKRILGITTVDKHSVVNNVYGGYIEKKDGKYRIIPARGEMGYIRVDEGDIISEFKKNNQKNPFKILINANKTILHNKANGSENGEYVPYQFPVSYRMAAGKVAAIGAPAEYEMEGYVISSGPMKGKKALYIITQEDESKSFIELEESDVDSYEIDLEAKWNQLGTTAYVFRSNKDELIEKMRNYYKLPEEGERKAVFYIQLGSDMYFGYTPYLRLFYDNSILGGVPKEMQNKRDSSVFDYAQSILGISNDKNQYKSRVLFEDAVSGENSRMEEMPRNAVLAEPKPSSYLDYLVQNGPEDQGGIITYNDDFRIRGYKQYWLKDSITDSRGSANVDSEFYCLEQGTKFYEKIHFHNLRDDELGLLLWCIRLEDGSQQNIGKGKPYGFGRIEITELKVKKVDYRKLYCADSFRFDAYSEAEEDISKWIELYKNYVTDTYHIDLMKQIGIQEFLIMKDYEHRPPKDQTEYMNIDRGDYKNRTKELPTPDAVAGKSISGQWHRGDSKVAEKTQSTVSVFSDHVKKGDIVSSFGKNEIVINAVVKNVTGTEVFFVDDKGEKRKIAEKDIKRAMHKDKRDSLGKILHVKDKVKITISQNGSSSTVERIEILND